MDLIFSRYRTLMLSLVYVTYNTHGFPDYQKMIPNGDNVPDPCNTNKIWQGVGHRVQDGGGARNPFGKDFEREKKWTMNMCDKDSDGDGHTNGEELGDPFCEWAEGKEPTRKVNITHPGVCEPIDSTECQGKNTWLDCPKTEQFCEAWTDKGTMSKTLRLPVTKIPAAKTTYFCQIFDLPGDGDYHLVGTKPIIDNADITHHILLFGCEDDEKLKSTPEPYRCQMVPHPKCILIIGTWTIGSEGDCFHRNEGFRVGIKGFKRAALQIHWNNPKANDFYTDSSGLEIFYTAKRRQYDAGMLAVGLEYLKIPPGKLSTQFESVCPKDCTEKMFKQKVYISRAVNHMHYMGIKQRISLYRDGVMVRDITNDEDYHYDSPKFYSFEPPVEVLPGDEIRTKCVYSSLGKNKTVYFGDGTDDEMCYGFITYYPVQPIRVPFCTTWKSVYKCRRHLPEYGGVYEGCKWREFMLGKDNKTKELIGKVMKNCKNNSCPSNCLPYAKELKGHPCVNGGIGDFLLTRLKVKEQFSQITQSCNFVGSHAVVCSYNTILIFLIQFACILRKWYIF